MVNATIYFAYRFLNSLSGGQKSTRDGFGHGLLEAGEKDRRIVALTADLTESTQTHLFAKKFLERFFEIGMVL